MTYGTRMQYRRQKTRKGTRVLTHTVVVPIQHLVEGAEGADGVAGLEELCEPLVIRVIDLRRPRVCEAHVEEQGTKARELSGLRHSRRGD